MSTTVQTTGVEFTSDRPLLVLIEKNAHNDWDINVSDKDKFPVDQQLYSDKMTQRLLAVSPNYLSFRQNWGQRGIHGGPPEPMFVSDPYHHPIVVRHLEYVRYQCRYPFMVNAQRDPSVTPDPRSPDNPFGWTNIQQATLEASTNLWVVIGRAQDNLGYQQFYKSIAWVDENGVTHGVDPDIVGL